MRVLRTSPRLFLAAGVVLAIAHRDGVRAKPCPDNAYFTFSIAHSETSVCACDGGLSCVGSRCIMGKNKNHGSFVDGVHGFPITCMDCFCTTFSKTERQTPFTLVETTDGTRSRCPFVTVHGVRRGGWALPGG